MAEEELASILLPILLEVGDHHLRQKTPMDLVEDLNRLDPEVV